LEKDLLGRFHCGRKKENHQFAKASGWASGFKVEKTWGEQIEDRGSQITYSALGQQAPIEEKKKWDPDFTSERRSRRSLIN